MTSYGRRSLWEFCQLSDPAEDWQTGTPNYSHLEKPKVKHFMSKQGSQNDLLPDLNLELAF